MKNIMRKITVFVLAVTMAVGCFSTMAWADTYTKIRSITLAVDSSSVKAGDDLDDAADDIQISVSSAIDASGNSLDTSTASFHIEDVDVESTNGNSTIKVGDVLKVTLYVYSQGNVLNYYTLKNATVHTTGATYVSCSRSQDEIKVVFKTKAIKGNYDSPDDVEWSSTLGTVTWSTPENGSGYYNLILYRNSSKVYEVKDYSGTSYNFYPWMTKEGTYSVKIRTTAHDSGVSSSAKSDWTESADLEIEESQVSNGSGQDSSSSGSSSSAGWYQTNGTWYYKFPDGSLKKNGWEKIGGVWYLFDANGAMKTGWVTSGNYQYYLKESGAMKTGWVKTTDNKWYYLNPNDGGPQGAMLKSQWLDYNGNKYYFSESGAMVTNWYKIDNKWYYFSPDSNGPEGALAKNKYIGTFYVGSDGAWIENY